MRDSLGEQIKYDYLGNTIIGLLSLSILINILFSVVGVYYAIKEFFVKEKRVAVSKELVKPSMIKVAPKETNLPEVTIKTKEIKPKRMSLDANQFFKKKKKKKGDKKLKKGVKHGLEALRITRVLTPISPRNKIEFTKKPTTPSRFVVERDRMGFKNYMLDRIKNNISVENPIEGFQLFKQMNSEIGPKTKKNEEDEKIKTIKNLKKRT